MTQDLGNRGLNEEPFPVQLLHALVAPLTFDAAASLCVEAWIRLGNAITATVLTPRSPTVLQTIVCRFISGKRPGFELFDVQETFSSLLDDDTIRQVAPTTSGSSDVHVLRWPQLLSCMVIEFKSTDNPINNHLHLAETLSSVCRSLLSKSNSHPVLSPATDHLAAMAEFAAGAGHEINNPLGSILGQTQLLLKSETQIDKRQSLETIGSQTWRIRDMIGDAMLFARPPAAEFVTDNLVEVVRKTTETTAANHAEPRSNQVIEVEFRCAESVINVQCDTVQIASLVSHLVRNGIESIKSAGEAGRVTVALRTSRRGNSVELLVRDSGHGVYEDTVRRHLFDPFFSGRPAGRGLGFGLSLAWQIVSMHHGILLQHNLPDQSGCEFHVALPVVQQME